MAQLELVRVVEVELADARPGLGQELRVLPDRRAALVDLVVAGGAARPARSGGGVGAGVSSGLNLFAQTSASSACLACCVLAHFTEAEAEQVVGGVEEAVVRELGQQPPVEVDGRRVVDPRRRRRRAGSAPSMRLLVGLVGVQVLLGRLLVVELGQAEHRVRRPALVVRVLEQERLEHRDRVAAALARLAIVEVDLRVVLGVDRLRSCPCRRASGSRGRCRGTRSPSRRSAGRPSPSRRAARDRAAGAPGAAPARGAAPAAWPRAGSAAQRGASDQQRPASRDARATLTCPPPAPCGSPRRGPSARGSSGWSAW